MPQLKDATAKVCDYVNNLANPNEAMVMEKIAEADILLKRIDATDREASKICEGCIFLKDNGDCRVFSIKDEFKCEGFVDDGNVIINKSYVWQIIKSNFTV